MVGQRTNGVEIVDRGTEGDGDPVVIDLDGGSSEATDDGGIPVIEPAILIIEPEQFESGKRRGRPKGSRNASGKQSSKEVSQDLTSLLFSAHLMLAALVKIPELKIDESEAKIMADAVARVNKEFGVQIMSPKTAALVNLGMATVTVYGPRVVAVVNNAKMKKKGTATAQTIQ